MVVVSVQTRSTPTVYRNNSESNSLVHILDHEVVGSDRDIKVSQGVKVKVKDVLETSSYLRRGCLDNRTSYTIL